MSNTILTEEKIKKSPNKIGQIGLKLNVKSKPYISQVSKKRLDNFSDIDSYIHVLIDKKRKILNQDKGLAHE